jgi:hypothetical protein
MKSESHVVEAVGTATVEAVGTATAHTNTRGENPVEIAMRNALIDVYREAETIWTRDDIEVDEKRKLIGDMLSDDNIRNRTLEARAKVRKSLRESS